MVPEEAIEIGNDLSIMDDIKEKANKVFYNISLNKFQIGDVVENGIVYGMKHPILYILEMSDIYDFSIWHEKYEKWTNKPIYCVNLDSLDYNGYTKGMFPEDSIELESSMDDLMDKLCTGENNGS